MNTNSRFTARKRRSQRGMSLIETMVAVLVFVVIFVAALMLYAVANRAYVQTEAATTQQQNVRFAMDQMVNNIRDSGGNVNPLGTSIPDEQLEGAWESAIFVRADYDSQRETPLESGTRTMVTTGNHEIVGYVLLKAGANSESISILADLTGSGGKRDATMNTATPPMPVSEETVTLNVAATTLDQQRDPPYQLARVRFTTAGAAVTEVIAENIFRLSFDYLGDTGSTAVITAGTASGAANTERDERARVRRIAINLIGMSDRPDFGYTDTVTYTPAVPASMANYRKFPMRERVWPVSLGLIGRMHASVPPLDLNAPASITACAGHRRNFHVSWPSSTSPGVTRYRVRITAPAAPSGTPPAPDAVDEIVDVPITRLEFQQGDATQRSYTFGVAALSNVGLIGPYSPTVSQTESHDAASIPAQVANVVVTGDGSSYQVGVNWDAVANNTGPITNVTCTTSGGGTSAPPATWNVRAVDLGAYRVHRLRSNGVNDGNFGTTTANQVDDDTFGTLSNSPTFTPPFRDKLAAPCSEYFYRVVAADLGGPTGPSSAELGAASAAMSTPRGFDAPSGVVPATPGAPLGPPVIVGANYQFTLSWPHVEQTSGGKPAATAHYIVVRERRLEDEVAYSPDGADTNVYDTNQLAQSVPVQVGSAPNVQDAFYRYTVKAQYDCTVPAGGPRLSAASQPLDVPCAPTPGSTATIDVPASGATFSRPFEGSVPMQLSVGGGTFTGARMRVRVGGLTLYDQTVGGAGPTYTLPPWNVSNTTTYPDGDYTIEGFALQGGCRVSAANQVVTLNTVNCGLQLVTPASYTSTTYRNLQFKLLNTCPAGVDITVSGLNVDWTGGPNPTATYSTFYNNVSRAVVGAPRSNNQDSIFGSGLNVTIAGGTATPNFFELRYGLAMKRTTAPASSATYTSIRFLTADLETLLSSITP